MSPTVVVDRSGKVVAVLGASGGDKDHNSCCTGDLQGIVSWAGNQRGSRLKEASPPALPKPGFIRVRYDALVGRRTSGFWTQDPALPHRRLNCPGADGGGSLGRHLGKRGLQERGRSGRLLNHFYKECQTRQNE